jgi:hypothetical protein
MSAKEVPKEPILLGFEPGDVNGDMGVIMVFRDKIAKSIYLMIKPGHLTNQYFPEYCMKTAELIRSEKPKNPQSLFNLMKLHHEGRAFFRAPFEETQTFMERLFEAVTGKRPIVYKVELSSS